MSLRFRLNLLLSILFVTVLVGGSGYVINGARRAVFDEVQSTADMTLQLVEAAIGNATADNAETVQHILDRLSRLDTTRHLQIAVLRHGSADGAVPPRPPVTVTADAPGWFVQLVKPPPMEFRRTFAGPGVAYTEILIQADPSDEITEVWQDARRVLVILLLFILLANILVYFTLGRDLAPIESILAGLGRIEEGDYDLRLPKFRLTELNRISEKFNNMADVLLRSREENRLLTQRTLEIQEAERRHLARELHDELGQSLSAVKALAVTVGRNVKEAPAPVRDNVETIVQITGRTYDVARNMIQRLRPSVLDELGLRAALEQLTDDWNAHHGDIFCEFNVEGDIDTLDDDVRINVYRFVQEALTNAARHSGASEVIVNISCVSDGEGRLLRLLIRDNGRGFDPGSARRGLGLMGMRERVEALNGELRMSTAPGRGVALDASIPMEEREEKEADG